jgi:hypothetical protein
MSDSPHRCDTCDANCNFNLPDDDYHDGALPPGTRISLRRVRHALDELDNLVFSSDTTDPTLIDLVTSKAYELRHLVSIFLDRYHFFSAVENTRSSRTVLFRGRSPELDE